MFKLLVGAIAEEFHRWKLVSSFRVFTDYSISRRIAPGTGYQEKLLEENCVC